MSFASAKATPKFFVALPGALEARCSALRIGEFMGVPQDSFLQQFQSEFSKRFGEDAILWQGGQSDRNSIRLPGIAGLRLGGVLRTSEKFELGDMRGDFLGKTLLIESESPKKELPL